MKCNKLIPVIIIVVTFMACNNGPKVITASNENDSGQEKSSGIFSDTDTPDFNETPKQGGSFTENLHTVIANKVLPTAKYVYINVTEAGKQYWIATAKTNVVIGNTYFYRKGLLKTNFESKEYKRVFDTIYLVSNIVAKNHGEHTGGLKADFMEEDLKKETVNSQKQDIPTHTEEIVQHKGSIKISELVANPSQFEGKTVQLTAKVVKVNPNIMNRNWLHLQDGSKNNYDLVATSNTFVPEGTTITIRAKVSLNRDFGAGYRYDLILEDGLLVE